MSDHSNGGLAAGTISATPIPAKEKSSLDSKTITAQEQRVVEKHSSGQINIEYSQKDSCQRDSIQKDSVDTANVLPSKLRGSIENPMQDPGAQKESL